MTLEGVGLIRSVRRRHYRGYRVTEARQKALADLTIQAGIIGPSPRP
jgi:hypothetical protein